MAKCSRRATPLQHDTTLPAADEHMLQRSSPMNILIVGAGAVGQVYGHHLSKSGDSVTYYVRPKYRASVESDLRLHQTSYFGTSEQSLSPEDVMASLDEVRSKPWDEVWLTVSSTALDGAWLAPLLQAANPSTVVTLQPGLATKQKITPALGHANLVSGAIAFLAWQVPLPGHSEPNEGVQYWFPPLSKSPFSGPSEPTQSIVNRLTRGGCPARTTLDASMWASTPSAMMMPLIAGLQLEAWSLSQFRNSVTLETSVRAAREALTVTKAHYKTPNPKSAWWLSRMLMRVILWLASRCAPFDLETYLAYHFTKVEDQTRALLGEYIATARVQEVPSEALQRLHQALQDQACGLAKER